MSSQAQVLANRRNAVKSTGPKTTQGKAVVAQNAIKHGFLAHQDLIQGEDRELFESRRRELIADLAPAGPMETTLAERIVSLTWRLKRAERLQNEVFDYLIADEIKESLSNYGDELSENDTKWILSRPDRDPHLAVGRAVYKDYTYREMALDRLMTYERRIEQSLYKTMNELYKLKLLREEAGHAKQSQSAAPGGSVKAEGLGDGSISSEGDHRQAALDAATRSAPPETANDSAKQSQCAAEEGPHGQQVAHPTREPSTQVPARGADNSPCETKPICGRGTPSPSCAWRCHPAAGSGRLGVRNKANGGSVKCEV